MSTKSSRSNIKNDTNNKSSKNISLSDCNSLCTQIEDSIQDNECEENDNSRDSDFNVGDCSTESSPNITISASISSIELQKADSIKINRNELLNLAPGGFTVCTYF